MKAVAPTTFARMSESLMSRKPLHKRLSRGLATHRSLPPIAEYNWRQQLPFISPQGFEMPGAGSRGLTTRFFNPRWVSSAAGGSSGNTGASEPKGFVCQGRNEMGSPAFLVQSGCGLEESSREPRTPLRSLRLGLLGM